MRPASPNGLRHAGMLCLALASVALAGCHTNVKDPGGLEPWEKGLLVYAAPDGKLSLDQKPTGDSYVLDPGLASGATQTADSWQGKPPKVFLLPAGTALGKNYFLNLSKPTGGILYLSNQVSQAQKGNTVYRGGVEDGRIRVELLVGGARVSGTEFAFGPWNYLLSGGLDDSIVPGWSHVPFHARPEVSVLPQGAELTMRITRWGGIADLIIGTTGNHASHFEIRYFDVDPLGGPLYLENGRLMSSVTGGSLVDETPFNAALPNVPVPPPTDLPAPARPPSVVSVDGAGPLLGLATLSLPFAGRRRVRAIASALVLLPLLSGCTGGSPSADPTGSGGPLQTRIEDDEGLRDKGIGALRGIVMNDDIVPLPVRNADVIVVRTNLFRVTDSNGQFAFPNVSAGEHVVRVQAVGYNSIQSPITVEVGKVLILNVTLERIRDTRRDPHTHPLWNQALSHVAYDEEFLPQASGDEIPGTGLRQGNEQLRDGTWYCSPAYTGATFFAQQFLGEDAAANSHYCSFEVPLETDTVIWPGTGSVEVSVTWEGGEHSPKEFGLSVATPLDRENYLAGSDGRTNFDPFVPRASGETFRIAMFPSEADPGHAKRTRWQFALHTPLFEFFAPDQTPLWTLTNVHVRITIHKSVVPFEPPHPDRWGGKSEIKLGSSTGDRRYQIYCPSNDGSSSESLLLPVFPAEGCRWRGGPKIDRYTPGDHWYYNQTNKDWEPTIIPVPPGTKSLRGIIHYTLTPTPVDWRLAYRPANMTVDPTAPAFMPAKMGEREADAATFKIDVSPDETDPFYSVWTEWRFHPDDGAPGSPDPYPDAYWYFTLDLWAIKDPNYGGD